MSSLFVESMDGEVTGCDFDLFRFTISLNAAVIAWPYIYRIAWPGSNVYKGQEKCYNDSKINSKMYQLYCKILFAFNAQYNYIIEIPYFMHFTT